MYTCIDIDIVITCGIIMMLHIMHTFAPTMNDHALIWYYNGRNESRSAGYPSGHWDRSKLLGSEYGKYIILHEP